MAYTTEMKYELLGVPKTVLKREGPVAAETALRMARGVRRRLGADVGLAATGVAGPDSDERGTPIGTGFIAVAGPRAGARGEQVKRIKCLGNRNAVRHRFAWAALDLLRRRLQP